MLTLEETGERRHEQCRYGIFSAEASRIYEGGKETPFAMPLCWFSPSEPVPPALKRGWSGAIEFARDCAICPAYASLEGEST